MGEDGNKPVVLSPPCVLQAALYWCQAVQECAIYADWPSTALKHWATEPGFGTDPLPIFRGPRLRMGVCRGIPASIAPDHLGRAEYRGAAVDRAVGLAGTGECVRGGAFFSPDVKPPSTDLLAKLA